MPNDSIREKVLQRLQNLLSAIQSGSIIEPANALPEPIIFLLDGLDTQASIDGWVPSGTADTPTLNTSLAIKPPGSMNVIKTINGGTAILTKTLSQSYDATNKVGFCFLYTRLVSLINAGGAPFTMRFGNDASNYYEHSFNFGTFTDACWCTLIVNIDGPAAVGPAPVVVGTPDKTKIQWIQFEGIPATGATDWLAGDIMLDWITLLNTTSWIPDGGADVPQLMNDGEAVIGTFAIGFGKLPNTDPIFVVAKEFINKTFDGTGADLEAWIFVRDKSKLSNNPPFGYSLAILAGQDAFNWYGKFLFHSDIRDVVNDLASGWNRIVFDPVTESDLINGAPDIKTLDFFVVGGIAIDMTTAIIVGDLRLDFIRLVGPDGPFNHDIKRVYRYAIGTQQTPASPSMSFVALNEDQSPDIYPIINATLLVGVDGEIELPKESLLDQELGRMADDIQVAIGQEQDLWDTAKYIKVNSLEFHVREGLHTGILTVILEIGYSFNLLDPTKKGL